MASIGESYISAIGRSYLAWLQANGVKKRTFWERVKEALGDKKLPTTQKFAATLAQVSQPSVSDWNKPGQGPELQNALRLAERLGVCVEWLYTERGPKNPGRPSDALGSTLWELWPQLPEKVRQDILGFATINAAKNPTKSDFLQTRNPPT